jgi:Fic family protein
MKRKMENLRNVFDRMEKLEDQQNKNEALRIAEADVITSKLEGAKQIVEEVTDLVAYQKQTKIRPLHPRVRITTKAPKVRSKASYFGR